MLFSMEAYFCRAVKKKFFVHNSELFSYIYKPVIVNLHFFPSNSDFTSRSSDFFVSEFRIYIS